MKAMIVQTIIILLLFLVVFTQMNNLAIHNADQDKTTAELTQALQIEINELESEVNSINDAMLKECGSMYDTMLQISASSCNEETGEAIESCRSAVTTAYNSYAQACKSRFN